MKFYIIFSILISTYSVVCAQHDSLVLPEAYISAPFNKSHDAASFVIKHAADTNINRPTISLAELIENDGIYLKVNNAGGLATAGNRGFGASHTKVYWNGFLLNSPLNGTIDLNLLNIDPAANDVVFVKSNKPVEGGNSASGGSIWIESGKNIKKNGLNASVSYGSFQTLKTSLAANFVKGRFYNQISAAYNSSENNYRYQSVLDFRRPWIRMSGADTKSWQINNSTGFQFADSKLTAHINFNGARRGIPPTITSAVPYSFQEDYSYRLGIGWEKNLRGSGRISMNAGYIDETLNYFPLRSSTEHSKYLVRAFSMAARYSTFIFGHDVRIHLNNTFYKVKSTELNAPDENQSIATIEVDKDYKRFFYGASLQKLFITDIEVPFAYRLYGGIKPLTGLKVSLAHARTRQIPTLNDRYWPITGNTDLKVESNLSYELNLSYDMRLAENYAFSLNSSLFHSTVDNWIAWIPIIGEFWRPFNVQKVVSKGIDLNLKNQFSLPESISLNLTYNMSLARPEVSENYLGSPAVVGKRLIYVPSLLQSLQLEINRFGHSFRSAFRHTGTRFTSANNDPLYQLPHYILMDVSYFYKKRFRHFEFQPGIRVNNIFNKAYETIAFRPMPGRYFELIIGAKI